MATPDSPDVAVVKDAQRTVYRENSASARNERCSD